MQTDQIFGGVAAITILAALWSRIKSLSLRLVSLFVCRLTLEGELVEAMHFYIWTNFRRSPFTEQSYGASSNFVSKVGRLINVGYEDVGSEMMFFWKGWRFLYVGCPLTQVASGHQHRRFELKTIRGMWDIDQLVQDALDAYDRARNGVTVVGGHDVVKTGRFRIARLTGSRNTNMAQTAQAGDTPSRAISSSRTPLNRRYLRWKIEDLGHIDRESKYLDLLSLDEKTMSVVEDARIWMKSRNWYKERGIDWRRGYLFYGLPGSGKSSIIRAIAQDLDIPLFSFDLSSMTNHDFVSNWREVMAYSPAIALMEDFDSVFDGRNNLTSTSTSSGVTFDCLLNCVSGVESASGVVLCITTNNISKLDPAIGTPTGSSLSSRPGRIDMVVETGPLSHGCRRKIASRILPEGYDIDAVVLAGCGEVGAQFQERCSKLALDEYWKNISSPSKKPLPAVKERSLASMSG